MGRHSCSIQQPVASVDVVANFRAQFKSSVPSETQLKEKAMKNATTQTPNDEHRFKLDLTLNAQFKRFVACSAIVAAASLAAHGTVGNQSASGY